MSLAICFPAPDRKMDVISPHFGQAKPFMFSMTPSTGTCSWRQNVMDLRTSTAATRWGVVTITAPSNRPISWHTESGSSPVPGGESITRQSRSPQATSLRNCLMAPIFSGPRQMTASSGEGKNRPIEMTFRPSTSAGAISPSLPPRIWCSRPSMVGMLGPWMSTSSSPTRRPDIINATARLTATVLLPTPPFPESTTILCRMRQSLDSSFWRSAKSASLSSGRRCPAEQSVLLQVRQAGADGSDGR